jgi:hypothetical protein
MSENSKPKLVETEDQHQGRAEPQTGSVFDDLDALRKASTFTVKRRSVLVNVPVDKPPSNAYFRVHPSWLLDEATTIKDPVSGAIYFVTPAMRAHPKLAPRLRKVTLAVISIWPADTVQIWPVPVLGDREFKAWKSARAAYELARDHWTQMVWDEARSDYTVETAEPDGGIDHEPNWPIDKTFNDLLKLGFADKIIDNEDHDYVRQLRGLSD